MTKTALHTLALLTALGSTTVAQAHPKLLASTPAPNATVGKISAITLRFSEKLIPAMTGADLVMTGMPGMAHPPMKMTGVTAKVGADRKSLMLKSAKPLGAGSYSVAWHAVAADTHRINGTLAFNVK